MIKCPFCGKMKYFSVFVKVQSVTSGQTKHAEICFKCIKKIGFDLPHDGD